MGYGVGVQHASCRSAQINRTLGSGLVFCIDTQNTRPDPNEDAVKKAAKRLFLQLVAATDGLPGLLRAIDKLDQLQVFRFNQAFLHQQIKVD